jgi:hypothetical protein
MDQHVLAGDGKGLLQAFRLQDGEPVWSTWIEGAVRGLGRSETTLFAGSLKGNVYAFPLPELADAGAIATLPPDRGGQELVGRPFPALEFDRWLGAAAPSPGDRRATLYRWWTETCPYCEASLPAVEQLRRTYEPRGLRVVCVYHPKPKRQVPDQEILAAARRLHYAGAIAVDGDWAALEAACKGSASFAATSVSFLVDADGIVRFVHPGPAFFPSDDPSHATAAADFALLERAVRILLGLGPGPESTGRR